MTRESISSSWADAGHAAWFVPLLDQFSLAIARGDHAGDEAEDAARCVELIEAAYASARKAGREVALAPRRTNGHLLSTGTG